MSWNVWRGSSKQDLFEKHKTGCVQVYLVYKQESVSSLKYNQKTTIRASVIINLFDGINSQKKCDFVTASSYKAATGQLSSLEIKPELKFSFAYSPCSSQPLFQVLSLISTCQSSTRMALNYYRKICERYCQSWSVRINTSSCHKYYNLLKVTLIYSFTLWLYLPAL